MANDLSAFQSEAWSSRMVEKLDQYNVMLGLVNRNWEGDLRQNKSVKIRTPGNIAMAPYTRGTTISYQDLAPTLETFTVNDGQYFAFEVDDLDRAQNDLNAIEIYSRRAAVTVSNVIETKLMATYVYAPGANIISGPAAGTGAVPGAVTVAGGGVTAIAVGAGGTGYGTTPPIVSFTGGGGQGARAHAVLTGGAVTSYVVDSPGVGYATAPTATVSGGGAIVLDSTTAPATGVYEQFIKARTIMSNNNVPLTGRWAVIDPATAGLLFDDTAHFVRASDLGDMVVQEGFIGARGAQDAPGFIGKVLDFAVYETPHVVVANGAKQILFGDNDAISYAAQITEYEAIRLQTTFANAIRGLLLHDTFVPAECARRLVVLRAA